MLDSFHVTCIDLAHRCYSFLRIKLLNLYLPGDEALPLNSESCRRYVYLFFCRCCKTVAAWPFSWISPDIKGPLNFAPCSAMPLQSAVGNTCIHTCTRSSIQNKNVKVCCNAGCVMHDPVVFKPNIMLKMTPSRCKPVQHPEYKN